MLMSHLFQLLCVDYTLGRCPSMEKEECHRNGYTRLHRCTVVVSTSPMTLCGEPRSGHAPGEACPHWD